MLSLKDHLAETISLMRGSGLPLEECLAEFRKQWLTFALIRARGNVCHAARDLGIHRNSLLRHISQLKIDLAAIRGQIMSKRKAEKLKRLGMLPKPPQSIGSVHASL